MRLLITLSSLILCLTAVAWGVGLLMRGVS